MNILVDLVPDSVEIDGIEYELHSDFRTSILFEMLMFDENVDDEEKVICALELYYPVCPKNIDEAIDKILWFYRGGKDVNLATSGGKGKSAKEVYNFEYDDEYIYAAFLDQYDIDLQDIEYLHWWKFKAMFKALKEDNEISKIMSYRSMDISKIKDKEQREHYKKLKRMYEIPKSKNEVEKINEIENILLNSGDISKIL